MYLNLNLGSHITAMSVINLKGKTTSNYKYSYLMLDIKEYGLSFKCRWNILVGH